MYRRLFGEEIGALLATTTKVVLAIGVVSYIAAHWAAKDTQNPHGVIARITGTEKQRLADLSARAGRDPMVTGSIQGFDGARITNGRIDPCAAPKPSR